MNSGFGAVAVLAAQNAHPTRAPEVQGCTCPSSLLSKTIGGWNSTGSPGASPSTDRIHYTDASFHLSSHPLKPPFPSFGFCREEKGGQDPSGLSKQEEEATLFTFCPQARGLSHKAFPGLLVLLCL